MMMTNERLAQLRYMRDGIRNELSPGDLFAVMLALADAVDEIDNLKRELEYTSMKLADRPDSLGFRQSDYERMRATARVLSEKAK